LNSFEPKYTEIIFRFVAYYLEFNKFQFSVWAETGRGESGFRLFRKHTSGIGESLLFIRVKAKSNWKGEAGFGWEKSLRTNPNLSSSYCSILSSSSSQPLLSLLSHCFPNFLLLNKYNIVLHK
jgi:hypothetical protein